jgi:hypothetical protein
MHPRGARLARGIALAVTAAVPLVVWPGIDTPFSTPKLWLLVSGLLAAGAVWLWSRGWRWATEGAGVLGIVVAAWCASWALSALLGDVVSLPALTLGVGASLWAVVLAGVVRNPRAVMAAQVAGSSAVALVSVLQWMGSDPFVAAGWIPPIAEASPRLAVYGTLGNPNFVACLLAASLPMSAGLFFSSGTVTRWAAVAAAGVMALALLATGSRAGALALGAAAVTSGVAGRGRPHRIVAVAALALAATAVAVSPARSLAETLSGRVYIWRTTWPHALERPIAGRGPGGFELSYPAWDRAARAGGHTRPGGSRFAGPQQHAHNDYLEALVERGIPGGGALVLTIGGMLAVAFQSARGGHDTAAAVAGAASLAALAAAALVDLPLARPAEAVHSWTAVAVIALSGSTGTSREASTPESQNHV